jgi:transglutaminase-like putative cysteine protease
MVRVVAPYASNALNTVHNETAQPTAENSAEQSVAPKWIDPGWVILDKTTYVRLDESGGYDATLEFFKKALTEEGVKALVEDKYNYDPNRETVTLENFATVKADGSILPVDPIAVLDRTADPTLPEPYLDDKRVKVIVFPDVAPGDVVRGRVTWHVRQSEFAERFASTYVQSVTQPIQNHRIVIDAPNNLAVQTKAIGVNETVEVKGDRIIRTVAFPQRDPAPLVDAADDFDVSPRYAISTFPSWDDVATRVREMNVTASQPDGVISAKAKELVAGVADRRERIKRIYDWVAQNIRYVAIETGLGGFKSMNAHQTFANRFGDCKAHVTLLKAMLAAIDEPAHMVLVNVVPNYRLYELPTPYFEHAILYAPSIDLYLDATSYQNPFGALPLPLADKPALDVETGAIVRIPLATPADVKLVAETHIDFAADGTAKAHTVMRGERSGDAMRRGAAEALQQSDQRAQLQSMLTVVGLDGSGDFSFGNPRPLRSVHDQSRL